MEERQKIVAVTTNNSCKCSNRYRSVSLLQI